MGSRLDGAALVLVFAGHLVGHVAPIEFLERLLYFVDEAAEVAVLHVRLHIRAEASVLAGDFVRANLAGDFGDHRERDVGESWAMAHKSHFFSTSFMPHLGQLPGLSLMTSECSFIGQVYW